MYIHIYVHTYSHIYIYLYLYIYMSNSLTIFLQIQRVARFFFRNTAFFTSLQGGGHSLRSRKSFFTKHAHLGHLSPALLWNLPSYYMDLSEKGVHTPNYLWSLDQHHFFPFSPTICKFSQIFRIIAWQLTGVFPACRIWASHCDQQVLLRSGLIWERFM